MQMPMKYVCMFEHFVYSLISCSHPIHPRPMQKPARSGWHGSMQLCTIPTGRPTILFFFTGWRADGPTPISRLVHKSRLIRMNKKSRRSCRMYKCLQIHE